MLRFARRLVLSKFLVIGSIAHGMSKPNCTTCCTHGYREPRVARFSLFMPRERDTTNHTHARGWRLAAHAFVAPTQAMYS